MEPLWARWEALKIDWSKLELSSLAGLPPLMTFIRDPATEDMFEEVCLTLFEIFVQRDFYLPLHFGCLWGAVEAQGTTSAVAAVV
jgi:hypothetical protein